MILLALNHIKFFYLFREKQERLERIREKLHQQMKQKVDDETDRISNAIQEFEAKKAKDEADQNAKRNKMMQSISEHRYQQVGSISS